MQKHPSHRSTPRRSAPFVKWLGGKAKVLPFIEPLLLEYKPRRLVEPFVGGGSVFLGTDFDEYLLADANSHLVNLYQAVQEDVDALVGKARPLFCAAANNPDIYYFIRNAFNTEGDPVTRAAYFLYLNKFGHRGMCRYNGSGEFNVPFGYNKSVPTLPEQELGTAADKLNRSSLLCSDFTTAFRLATPGDVIYCDPPYVDQDHAASFRSYVTGAFGDSQQRELADLARAAAKRGIPVVVSNHLTSYSRELYQGAAVYEIDVRRSIGAGKSTQKSAREGIFVFSPEP